MKMKLSVLGLVGMVMFLGRGAFAIRYLQLPSSGQSAEQQMKNKKRNFENLVANMLRGVKEDFALARSLKSLSDKWNNLMIAFNTRLSVFSKEPYIGYTIEKAGKMLEEFKKALTLLYVQRAQQINSTSSQ